MEEQNITQLVESIKIEISRKFALLETHILNLHFPLQSLNKLEDTLPKVHIFSDFLNSCLKTMDSNLSRMIREIKITVEDVKKDVTAVDILQTLNEIKYIVNRLKSIEKEISEIKLKGIKNDIEVSIKVDKNEIYETVPKPLITNDNLNLDLPENMQKLLDIYLSEGYAYKASLVANKMKMGVKRTYQLKKQLARHLRHPNRIKKINSYREGREKTILKYFIDFI